MLGSLLIFRVELLFYCTTNPLSNTHLYMEWQYLFLHLFSWMLAPPQMWLGDLVDLYSVGHLQASPSLCCDSSNPTVSVFTSEFWRQILSVLSEVEFSELVSYNLPTRQVWTWIVGPPRAWFTNEAGSLVKGTELVWFKNLLNNQISGKKLQQQKKNCNKK